MATRRTTTVLCVRRVYAGRTDTVYLTEFTTSIPREQCRLISRRSFIELHKITNVTSAREGRLHFRLTVSVTE